VDFREERETKIRTATVIIIRYVAIEARSRLFSQISGEFIISPSIKIKIYTMQVSY